MNVPDLNHNAAFMGLDAREHRRKNVLSNKNDSKASNFYGLKGEIEGGLDRAFDRYI
jgi:hypothetical protein